MNCSSAYLTPQNIEELHVEITNLCNAACPMCARNNSGFGMSENPGWGSWSKGEAKKVFSDSLPNLKRVFFCGTHGDPTAAPHLFEAVKICKERGLRVSIYTNGSARQEQWWKDLSQLLDEKDKIVFGIDGIETNHLYRQKTDIKKILSHLQICCDSAVSTQWDFLVFKHNEYELEKCKDLARNMGVDHFFLRKTARFYNDIFEVRGANDRITHLLEPPISSEYRHPDTNTIREIHQTLPKNYSIACGYRQLKKIYVNSRLEVFPCCYISDENERLRLNINPEKIQIPLKEFNLRHYDWTQILENSFYKKDFVDSFISKNVLDRCIRTCGLIKRESNQEEKVELRS